MQYLVMLTLTLAVIALIWLIDALFGEAVALTVYLVLAVIAAALMFKRH